MFRLCNGFVKQIFIEIIDPALVFVPSRRAFKMLAKTGGGLELLQSLARLLKRLNLIFDAVLAQRIERRKEFPHHDADRIHTPLRDG
jgi:hypothetical protein